MTYLKHTILPILLATTWISISEFVRNSVLLHSYWVEHYQALGLTFPEEPVNGAVWGIWSLSYAIGIFLISRRSSLLQTTFISWWLGFVLMWLVIGNMGVLPFPMLLFAIPLSILEAFIASLIIVKPSVTKGALHDS